MFALVAAVALAGCAKKEVLHIYTWADCISPDVVQAFEEKYNCKPAIDALDEKFCKAVVASPEIMARGQVILGLENIPGAMELYAKAWDRIKATK